MGNQQWIDSVRRAYEGNCDALFAYALSLTQSSAAAEDAVHSAFSKILRKGKWPREFRPYLFRCVRNAALDEMRGREKRKQREALFSERYEGNGHDPLFSAADIETAMETLNDNERECVVLKCFSGLTFQEIGNLKGVSINTTASWYRRAVAKMREVMEDKSHG